MAAAVATAVVDAVAALREGPAWTADAALREGPACAALASLARCAAGVVVADTARGTVHDIAGVEVEAVDACFDVEPKVVTGEVVFAAAAAGAGAADPVEEEPEVTGGFD